MKQNSALFIALALLIVAAYFFQEKRDEREYAESLVKGKLLLEEISSLKLPHAPAEKKDGRWWSGEQLLSHNQMKMIEQRLSKITSVKKIEGDPKNFFKDALDLEVNGIPWRIGEMSLTGQTFYVSKGDKISLAFIDLESGQVHTEDENVEEKKLQEFKSLLKKSLPELEEKQLFRFYPELPLQRVTVRPEGSMDYELLLEEDKTLPPSIEGVGVHENLKKKFVSALTQMNIKGEVPWPPKSKFKKISEMDFKAQDKSELRWEVWLMGKDSAEVMVVDDKNKRAFHMVGGTLRPFFFNVQDYWDKKIIPPEAFRNFDRLPVKFAQGSREVLVTVINREPLDFEAKGTRIKPGNMQDLFAPIFNLGRLDQASRVSQLSKSDREQFLNEGHLRLEVMEQELLCVKKKDELIVVNLTQGFKAHFLVPLESLRCQLEDVLE